ncbi:DUF6531 domain-containing protein [Streptomyces venezuelae]|uniref:Rhs protein n=3 Tax=Streptomyces venezuelae TaxID=54571 RepID=A0A5P2BHH3_STRVZ|nr:DUF6531 domain-containing protein [Streptomyces venezuelae]QES29557.1 hypothetical protein DEJ47_26705 [Streptomyces venezuelae]
MGSHRPSDWHVLDLEQDPTPGDPHRVRSLAKNLHDFADDVGRVLRDIKGMAGEDAVLKWVGKTADAFTEKFEDAPDKLKKLRKSYEMAGDALSAYWPELERAQTLADKALVKGREAQADLSSAKSRLSSADSWVERAGKEADKYKDKPGGGKDVPKPDEDKVRAATRNANSAEKAQKSAQGDVDAAKSALEAAKKMAADARKMREEAAGTAKKKIDEASDAGIPNRKWWEEVGDWVSDHWDTIVAVCKVVVAVVGIIAMIVGGPILAAIVIVAGAIVLADTLSKYAKGQATLMDVAFAAMDCIPGGKGLTTVGRLAKGMKGLGRGGLKGMARGLKNGLRRGADDVATSKPGKGRCKNGDPIDMVSGEMIMEETDVELSGLLPVVLRRTHLSTYTSGRSFGPSWASTLDERLELDHEGAVFASEDGMILTYPVPEPGTPVMPLHGPRLPLDWDGTPGAPIRITDPTTGLTRCFTPVARAAGNDAAFTLPLSAISDRNGHRIDFDRAADGTPVAVHHSGGYHIDVDTDRGRVTALRLRDPEAGPAGTTLLRYRYDADGNLGEIFNSSGTPFRFTYDERARVTSWTDRNGSWYRFTYDEHDRCIRGEGIDSILSCTITYDAEKRKTRYTNSLGHTTTYVHNELLQRTAVTDPLGHTTRSSWDRCNRLLSFTDSLGGSTTFDYDESGDLVAVHHPDGTTERAEYNEWHQPITTVGRDGAIWRHAYDERGNRVRTTDPAGFTTCYAYDDRGCPSAVTDQLNRTSLFESDAAGLLVGATDPLGNSARIERDAFGRAALVVDALGRRTRTGWTPEGKLEWREEADSGDRAQWVWDGEGNLLEHRDGAGRLTRFDTGAFDLPAGRTGPGGESYRFTYDTEMRLVQVADPQGLRWSYVYDEAGRLVSETDFNGRTLTYVHDSAGRLSARTNAGGETVSFTRDAMGRTIAQTTADGTTTYAYDAAGRLIHANNGPVDLRLERNVLGHVTTEDINGRLTAYTYDALGRRTARRTPGGHVSEWSFDDADRPCLLSSAGRTLAFDHDPMGREVTRRHSDVYTLTQFWDSADRLIGQTATAHPEGSGRLLQERTYTYQQDGRLAELRDRLRGTYRFTSGADGRTTAVTAEGWTEQYAYDTTGNLTHAESPHGRTTQGSSSAGAREFVGTLIRRAGRTVYEHDAQGRLTRKSRRLLNGRTRTWTYTWNAEDRLVETATPDGQHWRYLYDPVGRRVAKRCVSASGDTLQEIRFSWDGTRLAEQADSGGSVTTWDYTPGSHKPVAQTVYGDETDARFYSIVADLVGTPKELIDETGKIVWRHRATVWGATLPVEPGPVDCPLRFPGQYADAETGHHYNYHRHYDPETARYISPDPLGLEPAPNHHAYVASPDRTSDPLGLAPDECVPEGMDPEFPTIRLENYRGRFQASLARDGRQRLPRDWDAHHAIPQEYRGHPEFTDFDFDHPSNMRGILGSRSGGRTTNHHQDITNHWADFRAANPNATRAEIESFSRTIDEGFRDYYW